MQRRLKLAEQDALWKNQAFMAKYEAAKKHLITKEEEAKLLMQLKDNDEYRKFDALIKLYRGTHYWILAIIITNIYDEKLIEPLEHKALVAVMRLLFSEMNDTKNEDCYRKYVRYMIKRAIKNT